MSFLADIEIKGSIEPTAVWEIHSFQSSSEDTLWKNGHQYWDMGYTLTGVRRMMTTTFAVPFMSLLHCKSVTLKVELSM